MYRNAHVCQRHKSGIGNRIQVPAPPLVLVGGVALNVVSTKHLSRAEIFDKIWIRPAAGAEGGALGACMWMSYQVPNQKREVKKSDSMSGAFLGLDMPPYSNEDDEALDLVGAVWREMNDDDLEEAVAESIDKGEIVVVARDSAEFGPRALGNRSILADARSQMMQSHLNLQVRFRESFRPFAPTVLTEDAAESFDVRQQSPYMLLRYPVKENQRLAVNSDSCWHVLSWCSRKSQQLSAQICLKAFCAWYTF